MFLVFYIESSPYLPWLPNIETGFWFSRIESMIQLFSVTILQEWVDCWYISAVSGSNTTAPIPYMIGSSNILEIITFHHISEFLELRFCPFERPICMGCIFENAPRVCSFSFDSLMFLFTSRSLAHCFVHVCVIDDSHDVISLNCFATIGVFLVYFWREVDCFWFRLLYFELLKSFGYRSCFRFMPVTALWDWEWVWR